MTMQGYISLMMSVFTTILVLPVLEELLKVLVIAIVILVTIAINILFQWQRTKEIIVNQVVAEVMMKINNKFFLKEISKIVREALKDEKQLKK
ncbi:MAG: hypothetical protein AB1600_00355 [Bacteroidota bacterium]